MAGGRGTKSKDQSPKSQVSADSSPPKHSLLRTRRTTVMKAIVYHEHGSADVLKLEDVEKPAPKDNEVLIKVRAASINPLDWRLMRGEPKIIRVMARLMGGLGTG